MIYVSLAPSGLFLTLVALALCGGTGTQAADGVAKPFSIITGPVLQCPGETSMRVTWVTEYNATGLVEYGPVDGELKTATSSRHGLIDAQRLHSVLLENLRPGTEYRYRVSSREIVNFQAYKVRFGDAVTNEFRPFTTLDRKKTGFSFLVFNDIHDRVSTIPDLIKLAGKPYDLVILNGDILSHSDGEKPVLSILDQASESFASRIPMVWTRGNHEARGSFARELPGYMGLPQGRYYYAFDHGPVHFIVLDAGEDKTDSHREYHGLVDFSRYRRQQAEWLKTHVQSDAFKQARFRVVICHMPFPSKAAADPSLYPEKSAFTGMKDAYECFGQTLEVSGIDLMLSGHMHLAAVIPAETGRHSYPIVQGGGNIDDGRTLIRVDVSNQALNAVILRPDGSEAASCKVAARQ